MTPPRPLPAAAALAALLGVLAAPARGQDRAKQPPAPVQEKPPSDGPHLFHRADGSVLARWVVDGEVQEQAFGKGEPVALPRFAALLGAALRPRVHRPEPAVWAQPELMLVISDVEGEYRTMRRFLSGNGVLDREGRWSFGKGHLVCVGDMVDRGTEVTETQWLLYRLAEEAGAAGGHLHYVIGNHEVMMMGGDVRYTAKKYHDVARLLGLKTEGIVGPDTEIGRWWRSLNTVTRIGPYLFVHAGISPALATGKLDLQRLNEVLRGVFGTPPEAITNRNLLALSWGRQGPLWYRGYFPEFALDFGPTPTQADMDRLLANLGAKTIVVGHTKVERIAPLFGGRRLLPIDIPWTDPAKVRGLRIERRKGADRIDVVDIGGARTPIE